MARWSRCTPTAGCNTHTYKLSRYKLRPGQVLLVPVIWIEILDFEALRLDFWDGAGLVRGVVVAPGNPKEEAKLELKKNKSHANGFLLETVTQINFHTTPPPTKRL